MKYTIRDLLRDFPDDEACLRWLVEQQHPNGVTCSKCKIVTNHYLVRGRKAFACGRCGHQFYPMANSIFKGSSVPLTLWFYAMFCMSSTKSGYTAAQLSRDIGVTYKTAWSMLHRIRELMEDSTPILEGETEVDETYIHANVFKRSSAMVKYGPTGSRKGEVIFGAVQRGGQVKLWHVKSSGVRILSPIIEANIKVGSTIYSDGHGSYRLLGRKGYIHQSTNHSIGQYVDGNNYTQNIENVWSHLKRGIKGTYRHVSATHLQKYCNEFSFRYSNRGQSIFWALLAQL